MMDIVHFVLDILSNIVYDGSTMMSDYLSIGMTAIVTVTSEIVQTHCPEACLGFPPDPNRFFDRDIN